MKEILFRGKRIDNGDWVNGYYYESKISGCFILSTKFKVRGKDGVVIKDSFEVTKVIPETVGEYTGVTEFDSKDETINKKIFEGDIINYEYETFNKQKILVKYVIQYNAYEARFRAELTNDGIMYDLLAFRETQKRAEVIGNIYDNEELLKND